MKLLQKSKAPRIASGYVHRMCSIWSAEVLSFARRAWYPWLANATGWGDLILVTSFELVCFAGGGAKRLHARSFICCEAWVVAGTSMACFYSSLIERCKYCR